MKSRSQFLTEKFMDELGWLPDSVDRTCLEATGFDTDYQAFVRWLQVTQFERAGIHNRRLYEQHEAKLNRLSSLVTGEISAEDRQLAQADIDQDQSCRLFYRKLQGLYKHIQEMDQQARKPAQPSLPPPRLGVYDARPRSQGRSIWRGETSEPIELPVPEEYGFKLSLFVGGFQKRHRLIRGRLIANQTKLLTTLNDARVWLIPNATQNNWLETQLNPEGVFELSKVHPGSYTFEMAWSNGGFLEVPNVQITPSI